MGRPLGHWLPVLRNLGIARLSSPARILSGHSRRTRIWKSRWKSSLLRRVSRRHHLRRRSHSRIRSWRRRIPLDGVFSLFASSFVALTRRRFDDFSYFCLVNLPVLATAFNLEKVLDVLFFQRESCGRSDLKFEPADDICPFFFLRYLIHTTSLLDEIIELEEIERLLVEHGRPFERLALVFVKFDDSVDELAALWRVRLVENSQLQCCFRC